MGKRDTRRGDPLARARSLDVSTPQSVQARPDQVQNASGGWVFPVTPEVRVERFVVYGISDGAGQFSNGTARATDETTAFLAEYATEHNRELVDFLLDVSVRNRAPRVKPTLFAFAVALSVQASPGDRAHAWDVLPQIARTGSHVLQLFAYVRQFRGLGNGAKRGFGSWYMGKTTDDLAYQVVKYGTRAGKSHRDLTSQCHPGRPRRGKQAAVEPERAALFDWVQGRKPDPELLPPVVSAFEAAKTATVAETVRLVREHNLAWEMLPDKSLASPEVWAELAQRMPLGALVRKLPVLTNTGAIGRGKPLTALVAKRLTDPALVRSSRLHPFELLSACRVYAGGESVDGSGRWSPDPRIVDALSDSYELAWPNVEPSGERYLLALDVSGSMDSNPVQGSKLTAREGTVAMALATLYAESDVVVGGFTFAGERPFAAHHERSRVDWHGRVTDTHFSLMDVSKRRRLDDTVRYAQGFRGQFGRTDCAVPMQWAMRERIPFDKIVVYTDNETWFGDTHPFEALRAYRRAMGLQTKLVVVAMSGSQFTIADPSDRYMLDVTGFDAAAPGVISGF